MNYLCKNYPHIMRPLIFILLFSGLGTIIIITATIVEYWVNFKDAHIEFFEYSILGKIDD